jgi:hypothetical protein
VLFGVLETLGKIKRSLGEDISLEVLSKEKNKRKWGIRN